MLLCSKDCKNAAIGQWKSYLSEHKASKCRTLGCYGKDRSYSKFPRKLWVKLYRGTLADSAGWWTSVRQHSEESDEEEDEEEDDTNEEETEEEDEANEEESEEEEDADEEESEKKKIQMQHSYWKKRNSRFLL